MWAGMATAAMTVEAHSSSVADRGRGVTSGWYSARDADAKGLLRPSRRFHGITVRGVSFYSNCLDGQAVLPVGGKWAREEGRNAFLPGTG